jgi:hypothetical protein
MTRMVQLGARLGMGRLGARMFMGGFRMMGWRLYDEMDDSNGGVR